MKASTQRRFTTLDGSLNTLDDTLAVLSELLDLAPPLLFCVVDGFQDLDDRSTEQYICKLLGTLRHHMAKTGPSSMGSDRILKILFTTAGRADCLLEGFSEDELIFAKRPSAGRRPGKPMAGRRSLSPTPVRELQ